LKSFCQVDPRPLSSQPLGVAKITNNVKVEMSIVERGPAYRILTDRLLLRCWEPKDAVLLKTAIDDSLEHLRPWMPWVKHEPEDLEAKTARLRRFRGNFDLDRDFVYGIFNQDESKVLGGTGLHPRVGEGALEIGYWIHVEHTNQGLAAEAAAALTKVAFEINQVNRVEIHCDPNNVRSASVPRKLGYVQEAILRHRGHTPEGEPRDTMIWTMLAKEYTTGMVRGIEIKAFDVVGQRLL
jgi:RimJ/RimL family protein N-acetyltransferase